MVNTDLINIFFINEQWFCPWIGRTLHGKENEVDEQETEVQQRTSRSKFFLIAMLCSFLWYMVPGYLFQSLQSIAWVCWAFPNSVTAHQIGSGFRGLGFGALTLDWTVVASFLFSPLVCPFFAIVNVFIGYVLIIYIVMPISYWGLNVYNARTFPIFSSHLFTAQGQSYNITAIVNDKFEIDLAQYDIQGRLNLSLFFALAYGFGFATIASTLSHVGLFYGRYTFSFPLLFTWCSLPTFHFVAQDQHFSWVLNSCWK